MRTMAALGRRWKRHGVRIECALMGALLGLIILQGFRGGMAETKPAVA